MLVLENDQWLVRDLDSLNGTFVNGHEIGEDTPVGDGDVIRLGHNGPRLRLVLPRGSRASALFEEAAMPPTEVRAATAEPPAGPAAGPPPRRAREGVPRRWLVSAALFVLVAAGGVGLWAYQERGRMEWEREKTALLLRMDSVLDANATAEALFEGQLTELADSLRRSSRTVSALVAELETTSRNADIERREALQSELEEALAGQAELRLVASFDWAPIRERATSALARVFVERESGDLESGTAFSVGDDGTMVTSGHLVVGADGSDPPRRIAVQFAEADEVLPAEFIASAPEDDLAVIRVPGRGSEIGLLRMNQRLDSVQSGQPVILVGFPLQQAVSTEDASPTAARPLAWAGVLQGITSGRVELSGYGARGASGSPVMDATGSVLGLLRGSVERDGQTILVAVSSAIIMELLATRMP